MKKVLSIILSLVMVLSVFSVMPLTVFAMDGTGPALEPISDASRAEIATIIMRLDSAGMI